MTEATVRDRRTDSVEPERYELFESSRYRFELNRRRFLQFFGGGLIFIIPARMLLAQQGESGGESSSDEAPQQIGAWLQIEQDGSVKVFTGKTEMGQNIRTSLTQAVADELRSPVSAIRLVMADTELTPYDMGTFGSLSTPRMAPQLRKAAAAAREAMMDLAAQRWGIRRSAVRVVNGRLLNDQTRESFSFGDIARGQALLKAIPEETATTPRAEWTIAGTSVPKIDGRDFVTGKHQYTSDIRRPGMLFGAVVRPTSFKATLVSANTAGAERMEGVTVVRDGDFLGIAAPDPLTAQRAAASVTAEWKGAPQPSNVELFELLQLPAKASSERRWDSRKPLIMGSIDAGLIAAEKKLEQTYTVAYIAHIPLEPRAAVAEWKAGKLTVWTGTQRPFGVRTELAKAFRLSEEKVRVIVPDTGSGYGGKHTGECAIEAARIARSTGKPVKLVWSREEEFSWAYFRPAGVIRVRSGATGDGRITAWEFHNYNSGPSAIEGKYDIPNQHVEFHPSDSPLRQGSYRALAATANHFARETHIDEIAYAVGMDPLAFRLKNSSDARLHDVLRAAADKFGWGMRKPDKSRGFGIACGFEKGSYVATCIELAIRKPQKGNGGEIEILRVVQSFDCGPVVNPAHLKNQIEGCIMMGIGGALFEEIHFANGKILNPKLSRYRVPRFRNLPAAVEIVLVDRKDIPSAGAGETPIVGIAPAIGNAIFQAAGVRLRSLPLVPNGLAI